MTFRIRNMANKVVVMVEIHIKKETSDQEEEEEAGSRCSVSFQPGPAELEIHPKQKNHPKTDLEMTVNKP